MPSAERIFRDLVAKLIVSHPTVSLLCFLAEITQIELNLMGDTPLFFVF